MKLYTSPSIYACFAPLESKVISRPSTLIVLSEIVNSSFPSTNTGLIVRLDNGPVDVFHPLKGLNIYDFNLIYCAEFRTSSPGR